MRAFADFLPTLLKRNAPTAAFFILLAVFSTNPLLAQNTVHVKGRVSDEKGAPIPNVTVSVKGSTTGANGDANGNFEINVPSNATLVISSVGFDKKEVSVRGQATLSVSLTSSRNTMDEVIVVGYGTQKKRD